MMLAKLKKNFETPFSIRTSEIQNSKLGSNELPNFEVFSEEREVRSLTGRGIRNHA